MFENCLAADVLASLRGRASGWSEDAAGQRLARLSIKVDSSNRANQGGSSSDEYWISGDHLGGSLAVESALPITITRARISLEDFGNKEQFLSQVHQLDPRDFCRVVIDGSGTKATSAHFAFSISHAALTKAPNVPQQCLQLPPSMTVGAILQDENSGLDYAQPKIIYSLVANVEIRSGSGHQMTIYGSKEVPIWLFSAPSPPVDTRDFPAEFVEELYHPCRPNRFRKETFLVTVSSAEPSPVRFDNRRTRGNVTCKVVVTVADTRLGSDVDRLLELSPKIRLSVTPALRIKTFYSMSPFSRMPGQTMLTTTGRIRLHDELRTLPSISYSNLGWHSNQADVDDHEAQSLGSAVFATVSMVLPIPPGLPPSFCSAVVSQQYSLIMQCKIKGVQVDTFGLEVPLQIFYDRSKSGQKLENGMSGSPLVADSLERSISQRSADRLEGNGAVSPTLQQDHRLSPPDYGL
ncbi:uncharacterized protein HMPREF1541_11151 [Cyphellophora europaea CBS 101466]|uniref:Arrestin-like N-terminal domain-containing protein n=1 Tax=Cyphellophora europaea (strain CBS 101466) TaxID=1220924 RepID=W2S6T6_CYPE1|nr:uncharacterized protein HMPREF1541_10446 [Cyphellophora europaea CBS 101466]XP_008714042.1 uncharacterized protein HMPREF1541_11151 [Cyphellophora europaea CBS 101466]ETN43758.1 hypothetical protein HMPREF1541_11151 [Cyphellophora europaea CBS 101466]ETN44776.1 hypothetical protein HMPREF1541_10446 [Cyphellophora europaea CBS 101466]